MSPLSRDLSLAGGRERRQEEIFEASERPRGKATRQGTWAASEAKPAPASAGTGTSLLFPQQRGRASDPKELGSYPFPAPAERRPEMTHISRE